MTMMKNNYNTAIEFVIDIYTQLDCDYCSASLNPEKTPLECKNPEAFFHWSNVLGWEITWADRITGVSQKCPECAKKVTI